MNRLRRLAWVGCDQSGVTALEYAFIAGLAAILIVAGVTSIGTEVSGLFNSVTVGL
jgi:pilus assembly protein Flp/PilA